jgi:chaperone required for assembly of F1-ATPase
MTVGEKDGRKSPGREERPLPPRRFYKSVSVEAADAAHRVLLDGKTVRTPAKAMFAVPTRALAQAIAAEWEAQREHIDPATMPLTKLTNSGLDGVRGREAAVRDDIVKYAASDLVCYRASQPEQLVRRQAELWDPILAWSRNALGATFVAAEGLMPVAQPEAAKAAVARALVSYDAFALAALHVMTTLMGSALLALAHAHGRLGVEAAWTAAHVDEDWQIARWGEDALAAARRHNRCLEMQAASRLFALLSTQ